MCSMKGHIWFISHTEITKATIWMAETIHITNTQIIENIIVCLMNSEQGVEERAYFSRSNSTERSSLALFSGKLETHQRIPIRTVPKSWRFWF